MLGTLLSEWEGEKVDATMFKISVYLRHFSGPETQPHVHRHCDRFCLVPESAWKHIYIMDCPDADPYISLQIVGRHLVVIVAAAWEHIGEFGQDNIFIYDFISDVLLMVSSSVDSSM
jgi:hypothetical protein